MAAFQVTAEAASTVPQAAVLSNILLHSVPHALRPAHTIRPIFILRLCLRASRE
jgi:hypothetical protein